MSAFFKALIYSGIVSCGLFCFCQDQSPSATSQRPLKPWELLPADNAVVGWVQDTSASCFTGKPIADTGLYALINGAATVYVQNGFVCGAFAGYSRGAEERVCVQIFDQTSPADAKAVFDSTDRSGYEPIPALADTARLDTLLLFDYVLEMTMDRYFCRFIMAKDELHKLAANALARKMLERL